ncbi:hypothetical protein GVAV_003189 [Gurleya vavrai]
MQSENSDFENVVYSSIDERRSKKEDTKVQKNIKFFCDHHIILFCIANLLGLGVAVFFVVPKQTVSYEIFEIICIYFMLYLIVCSLYILLACLLNQNNQKNEQSKIIIWFTMVVIVLLGILYYIESYKKYLYWFYFNNINQKYLQGVYFYVKNFFETNDDKIKFGQ